MRRRGQHRASAKHEENGASGMAISGESMQRLKRLDIYARPKKEFQRATLHGAAVSIFLAVASVALIWRELAFSMRTETVERLFVNSTISPTVNVTFDVVFSRIPCSFISLDAEDSTGSPQKDVLNEVTRTRLDRNGVSLDDEERHEMGNTLKEVLATVEGGNDDPIKNPENNPAGGADKSGTVSRSEAECNCYGAGAAGECCRTCEDVKGAYRRKGWRMDPSKVPICVEEGGGVASELEGGSTKGIVEDEGCRLAGFLELKTTNGNFHFAPGHRLHRHVSALSLMDRIQVALESFNTTHTIHSLTLGEEPPAEHASPKHLAASTVLHGHQKTVLDTHAMHQYFLQVVPTVFRLANGFTVHSNQFSVTEHLKHVPEGPSRGLPGVYFFYEMSPVQALVEERRRGFLAFMTGACGVVGGVYTILGLVHTGIDGLLASGHNHRRR